MSDLADVLGKASRLKRKASRLRDWNISLLLEKTAKEPTWKEKHLDYEIETTRENLIRDLRLMASWKEKHLDYEIETQLE